MEQVRPTLVPFPIQTVRFLGGTIVAFRPFLLELVIIPFERATRIQQGVVANRNSGKLQIPRSIPATWSPGEPGSLISTLHTMCNRPAPLDPYSVVLIEICGGRLLAQSFRRSSATMSANSSRRSFRRRRARLLSGDPVASRNTTSRSSAFLGVVRIGT